VRRALAAPMQRDGPAGCAQDLHPERSRGGSVCRLFSGQRGGRGGRFAGCPPRAGVPPRPGSPRGPGSRPRGLRRRAGIRLGGLPFALGSGIRYTTSARSGSSGSALPLGYGVIGSPADSGSVSLGSSPGTPAFDGPVLSAPGPFCCLRVTGLSPLGGGGRSGRPGLRRPGSAPARSAPARSAPARFCAGQVCAGQVCAGQVCHCPGVRPARACRLSSGRADCPGVSLSGRADCPGVSLPGDAGGAQAVHVSCGTAPVCRLGHDRERFSFGERNSRYAHEKSSS
jgi:hypothetical protein